MRRRDFSRLVGSLPLAVAFGAKAQQPGKIPVVGVMWHGANEKEETYWFGLQRSVFAELGYIPGKNIVFEDRFAAESAERHVSNAAELVRLKVDILIMNNFPATIAAQKATSTIPIVFMVADPVRQGVVPNLPHPGGNATGLSYMFFEMDGKRLELFKKAIPSLARVGLLLNPDFAFNYAADKEQYEAAAPRNGITIEIFEARSEDELKSTFLKMGDSHLDGLIIGTVPMFEILHTKIAKMALETRIPAIANQDYWSNEGTLLSYASTLPRTNTEGATRRHKTRGGRITTPLLPR